MDTNEIEIPLPRGGRMALRPVTDADEEFLLSIYAGSRADELAQAQWAAGQQEAFVKWQFDRIWIGRDDRQIRLLDIAILPEFQNRGAGTMLLHRLIDESKRAGKALRHMVFVLNNDAHRFYERLGFVVIEEFGAYKHMEWKSEPPAVAGG
ncbi:MAG: hypothetical protein DMF70_01970 [Acidobacteria bacterium]|nr:MAG: hypothetical protein DMF70_01970 [Acidobacteriota bacterium]